MQNFQVFYRVPANDKHGTYLASTRQEATTRDEAVAKVAEKHPEYTELH